MRARLQAGAAGVLVRVGARVEGRGSAYFLSGASSGGSGAAAAAAAAAVAVARSAETAAEMAAAGLVVEAWEVHLVGLGLELGLGLGLS